MATFNGTSGSETVTDGGAPTDDVLFGFGGNDTLTAASGEDTLYGGTGNDILDGGLDTDDFYGGSGNDTFLSTGNVFLANVYGGAGRDLLDLSGFTGSQGFIVDMTINNYRFDPNIFGSNGSYDIFSVEDVIGSDNNDTITGSSGFNSLFGGDGVDFLYGGGGKDTLSGDNHNDALYGGTGDDRLFGGEGIDTLIGGSGDDYLEGGIGNDALFGSNDNDTLLGGGSIDTLYGGGGDDLLNGGLNKDTSYGGGGEDLFRVVGDDYGDNVHGGAGRDTLDLSLSTILNGFVVDMTADSYGFVGNPYGAGGVYDLTSVENVIGTQSEDTITGSVGFNSLFGLDGNDRLFGGDGKDTLFGGLGDDHLTGGNHDDALFGASGADLLYGGVGDDKLVGGAGTDQLYGGSGLDEIGGGGGNDGLWVFTETDFEAGESYLGGGGTDTLYLDDSGSYSFDLRTVTTLGIEGLDIGDPGANNTVDIRLNASQLGNNGFQTVTFSGFSDVRETVTINMNDGPLIDLRDLTLFNTDPNDRFQVVGSNVADTITGSTLNDTLFGQSGNDIIGGGLGHDRLVGGDASDRLFGGNGDDILVGGNGIDTLVGGAGEDVLVGGAARDFLTGGDGADVFDFNYISDSRKGSIRRDTINDFDNSEDLIDLSSLDANKNIGGNQSFTFIGTAAFSNTAGEVRVAAAGGNNVIIQTDANGDGVAEMEIRMLNPGALNAGDFIL